jgi:glucose-1-phosphate adenylyltransferase
MNGGVHVLSPYQQIKGTEWYKGTANAIYQNIHFIDRYNPEYVAVLSGDHIYKMDYAKMLEYHKEKNAACTIAMLEVPWDEASRFGLMFVEPDGSISEFEEKPKKPRSNKASMGVYIFTWSKLRQYLIDDENDPTSGNDFGHNVIPAMHSAGERMFAYQFDGYWKDVGTIDSLWEANLDLLNPKVDLDLSDDKWKIYSQSPVAPPHFISDKAAVENSMISEGCEIHGVVDYSILFSNVTVEEGATVRYSIVMPGTVIKAGAVVEYAIVAENAVIAEGAHVGDSPEAMADDLDNWGIAVIGEKVTIGKGAKVNAKQMIDTDMEGEAK